MKESVVFTFPYQTNGNHATEPSAVGRVTSERHWKNTFDFNENVSNYGLNPGAVCQLYVLVMSRTRFRVNPHYIVA